MSDVFSEYQSLFLEEAEEHISSLNEMLLVLEKKKKNRKLIDSIFRVLHTLKSSAAAVGFQDLGRLAHRAEDLIQQIRSDDKKVDKRIINTLFEVVDISKMFLDSAKEKKEEGIDFQEITSKLDKIIGRSDLRSSKGSRGIKSSKKVRVFRFNELQKKQIQEAGKKGSASYLLKIEIDPREQIKWLRAELLIDKIGERGEILKIFPEKDKISSMTFDGRMSVLLISKEKTDTIYHAVKMDLVKELIIEPITDVEKGVVIGSDQSEDIETHERKNEISEEELSEAYLTSKSNTIRVPVSKLDDLMHLVGELAIANSGLIAVENGLSETHGDTEFYHNMNFFTDRIIKISSDLQNSIMKVRMLPIYTTFNQFRRVVRDLSIAEKKEIDLVIEGGNTELDKKVIDEMSDPLMHLVRNAVDHGIEKPAGRMRMGKSSGGTIVLSASQSGNRIHISVKDDGRGIDLKKVKENAVRKGLLKGSNVNKMGEKEIFNLIFEPGFSTSEKINTISGRGVGLDVVVNKITSLGGSVNVNTEPGKGTEFNIILPLTLAITTIIIVESGENVYGVPISDIQEISIINRQDIKDLEGVKAINYRDEVLPLIDLNVIFEEKNNGSEMIHNHEMIPVIVVSYRDKKIGLVVDGIRRKQEIVLKPLEKHFRSIRGISGAAVLGDGNTILVIDILGFINVFTNVEELKRENLSNLVHEEEN